MVQSAKSNSDVKQKNIKIKNNKDVKVKVKENENIQNKKNSMPNEIKDTLKFNTGLLELKNKIDNDITALKNIKTELKKLELNYQQDLTKVWKSKKKRTNSGEKTGFIKKKKLPKKLARLIDVEEGTEMSMPDYTSKFFEKVLKERNLFYQQNKRVFRADKELMETFNLPESVNVSTDHRDKKGFNFSTLQKYFSKAMKDEEMDKIEDKQDDEQDDEQDEKKIDKKVEMKAKIVPKQQNKERLAKA